MVHHALCAALEPVLERYAIDDSFACRPGKGSHAAVERARGFTRRYRYFLKLDVRHFFETCDQGVLAALLQRLVKDRRLLDLCRLFIDAGAPGSLPGQGLPIGNLTSQHFANLYLGPLDHLVKETLRVRGYLRYMDDLLLFGDDQARLWRRHREVRRFVEQELRLELKREATVLAPVSEGVPFLGFRVWPGVVRLDRKRARRLGRRLRSLQRGIDRGVLDEDAAARSAQSIVGWAAQAHTLGFRRCIISRMGDLEDGRMAHRELVAELAQQQALQAAAARPGNGRG